MNRLTQYIGFTFLKWTGLVLFFLTILLSFFNIVAQFQYIGSGAYSALDAFIYTFQTLPAFIYQLFPIIGLLGALVGLGQLASGSELIVMRASGYSRLQIACAVLLFALPLSIAAMLVGEGLAPGWVREANIHQAMALNRGADMIHGGGWLLSTNAGIRDFIHVGEKKSPTQLLDVTSFQFNNDSHLQAMRSASELNFSNGHWQAQNVSTTVLKYDGSNLIGTGIETPVTQQWNVSLDPKVLGSDMVSVGDVAALTLSELSRQVDSKRKNTLSFAGYQLEFWQRIFQPIETLVMIFLAIPFVFGSLRNTSMVFRLAVGGGIGFVFYVLNQYAGFLSIILQISPIIGAAAPMILFFFIGLLLIRKRF